MEPPVLVITMGETTTVGELGAGLTLTQTLGRQLGELGAGLYLNDGHQEPLLVLFMHCTADGANSPAELWGGRKTEIKWIQDRSIQSASIDKLYTSCSVHVHTVTATCITVP